MSRLALLCLLLVLGQPLVEHRFGILISIGGLSAHEFALLGVVEAACFLFGSIPSHRA